MKTCSRCATSLPASEFHKCSKKPDGLQAMCKTCQRENRAAVYKRGDGLITVEEIDRSLHREMTGTVVGHLIGGKIVYDKKRPPHRATGELLG